MNPEVRKAKKQLSEEKKIKQVVYVISRKLKREGYPANHFINEIFNDGRFEKFYQYVSDQYKVQLEFEIKKALE